MTRLNRRQFAASAMVTAAFAGLAHRASAAPVDGGYANQVPGYGPLASDPGGLLDLPAGFSYQVIDRAGGVMADGYVTPGNFDGMGCIALDDGRVVLVRNHELLPRAMDRGAAGADLALNQRLAASDIYAHIPDGRAMPGGTTNLVYNLKTRRTERVHLSLAGTAQNCAGGTTPWGSWLSCEESVMTAPGSDQSHGWVFEVPAAATGLVKPVPLKAMGRFKHEAVAVDPASGTVYLTEDHQAGLFYRFLPTEPGNLAAGGRLQALGFADAPGGGDSRNWDDVRWRAGDSLAVRWVDVDDVESPNDDLRDRGHAAGAARFARGEGIHLGLTPADGAPDVYFTCTSGGPAKHGQIMRYRPGAAGGDGTIQLFIESADPRLMDYADNITMAPWGDLIVCEDRSGDAVNYLRGVTPAGQIYTLARLRLPTETAGVCFAPDGATMFVNIYHPGHTLAIRGPWDQLRTA